MIDLALQSPHIAPPRLMFTSSIGNVKGELNYSLKIWGLKYSF